MILFLLLLISNDVDPNIGLNAANTGVNYFREGDYSSAIKAFDAYTNIVESVSYGAEQAKKSRKYSKRDQDKPFKGETHEKGMIYLLKGLSYLKLKEFQQARACFKSISFHDVYYDLNDNKMTDDDWLSSYYLGAYASYLAGDREDAQAQYDKVPVDYQFQKPPFFDEFEQLTIVFYGKGPIKNQVGPQKELLKYTCERNTFYTVFGGGDLVLFPLDDLFYQASTRGHRKVDFFLGRKAVMSSTAGTTAGLLADLGVSMFNIGSGIDSKGTQEAALVVGAIGLIADVLSRKGHPEADIRMIENLPRFVSVVPMDKNSSGTIHFGDANFNIQESADLEASSDTLRLLFWE